MVTQPRIRYFPGLINFHLRPSPSEAAKMTQCMVSKFGLHGAAELIGVPVMTVKGWMHGMCREAPSLRTVWLSYVILVDPSSVETLFDLATWGRFRSVDRSELDKDT